MPKGRHFLLASAASTATLAPGLTLRSRNAVLRTSSAEARQAQEPIDTRNNCWRYLDQTDAVCHSTEESDAEKCRQHFCGPIFEATAGSCAEAGGGEEWKHQWERLQASVNQFCPETPPRHAGGDVEKSSDPEYQEEHFLDKKLGASCSD